MANIVDIIIRAKDQASSEINKVKGASEELSKTQKALQGAFKIAQGAAIGAGLAFLSQVPALTKQGIAIGKAEKALEGYTGGAQQAEMWTRAVEKAAGGALSRFDAIQNATRFAAMGLATTSTEAAKLTEIAVTLGAAMGKDATGALEDFSLMLANQSIPRLDTFGISGAQVRQRMQELAEATGETDRQVLFLNATMEIGTQKLNQLKDAGFEATDSTQKLSSWWQNAKDSAAKFLADGLTPIIDGVEGVTGAMEDEQAQIIKNADSYDDYRDQIEKLSQRVPVLSLLIDDLSQDEFENQQRIMKLDEWHAIWDESVQTTQDYLNRFVYNGVAPATEAIAGMTRATSDVNLLMQEYSKQLLFNLAAANLDEEAQFTLAKKMGLIDDETWLAYEAMQGLTEQYNLGRIKADEYINSTATLGRTIDDLHDKSVTITVTTEYYEVQKGGSTTKNVATAKQVGGWVQRGGLYTVGEAGPETFIPNSSGVVVPNHVVHNWNLTINEAGRVVNPVHSFAMMQALAGA